VDCDLWMRDENCPKDCDFRHNRDSKLNNVECSSWKDGKCENVKCSGRHPKITTSSQIVVHSEAQPTQYSKQMHDLEMEVAQLKFQNKFQEEKTKLQLDHSVAISDLKLEVMKANMNMELEKTKREMEEKFNKNQSVIIQNANAPNLANVPFNPRPYFIWNTGRIGPNLTHNPGRRSIQSTAAVWNVAQTTEFLQIGCSVEFLVEACSNIIVGISPYSIGITGNYAGYNATFGIGYQFNGTVHHSGGSFAAYNVGDKIRIYRDNQGVTYHFYKNDAFIFSRGVDPSPFVVNYYPTVSMHSPGSTVILL